MNEEDFYFEESNVKQVITKLIIFTILLVIGIFAYKFYKSRYTLNVRNINYNVGDKLSYDIKKYIKSKKIGEDDEYILELGNVPIEKDVIVKAGEYKYTLEYKNTKKTGTIKVVDKVAPVVETENITIGLNEEFTGDDFILSCEDYSKPCRVELKKDEDYDLSKKEGTYNIGLIIKDAYDNKTEKEVTLTVKKGAKYENSKEKDLEIDHISPDHNDFDNKLLLKYNKAVSYSAASDTDLFHELLEITSSDLNEYLPSEYSSRKIKEYETIYAYNKYGYIVGYSIRILLDNGKSFYINEKITKEE